VRENALNERPFGKASFQSPRIKGPKGGKGRYPKRRPKEGKKGVGPLRKGSLKFWGKRKGQK